LEFRRVLFRSQPAWVRSGIRRRGSQSNTGFRWRDRALFHNAGGTTSCRGAWGTDSSTSAGLTDATWSRNDSTRRISMLGERISAESGKVTAQRVLPNPGGGPKMETSFQATGK